MWRISLNSSQLAMGESCRYQHFLTYRRGIRPLATAANLAFGDAVDEAVRAFLLATASGASVPDPVATFLQRWDSLQIAGPLRFAATHTPKMFRKMGTDLMAALPAAWRSTGLTIAVDASDAPLVNVALSMELGARGDLSVEWRGLIDFMAFTDEGHLAVLDIKTATSGHTTLFTRRADQLTSYQLLIGAHQGRLGLPPLRRLGFWDLLKRRARASILAPLLVVPRSAPELEEFVDKIFWFAEDIQRRRFPRASRMQFNSPCAMCDLAALCVDGDKDGLHVPAVAQIDADVPQVRVELSRGAPRALSSSP